MEKVIRELNLAKQELDAAVARVKARIQKLEATEKRLPPPKIGRPRKMPDLHF